MDTARQPCVRDDTAVRTWQLVREPFTARAWRRVAYPWLGRALAALQPRLAATLPARPQVHVMPGPGFTWTPTVG